MCIWRIFPKCMGRKKKSMESQIRRRIYVFENSKNNNITYEYINVKKNSDILNGQASLECIQIFK
jgi:hypothetical protein